MNSFQQPIAGEQSAGTLHLIPTEDRPTVWIVNAANTTSWGTGDFSSYVPAGVKALHLHGVVSYNYNATSPYFGAQLDRYGGTATDNAQFQMMIVYDNATGSGKTNQIYYPTIICPCDSSGKIRYRNYAGAPLTGALYLNITGYYI